MPKNKCPRKSFLQESFPMGPSKHQSLRRILKEVLMALDPCSSNLSDIPALVSASFQSHKKRMASFEMESERIRMEQLISRWFSWEQMHTGASRGMVLSKDFQQVTQVGGCSKKTSVHWLVRRGDVLEAIRFSYKAPQYNPRARTPEKLPEYSEELLRLQRAGEEEAKHLGLDPAKTPVWGAIYSLKAKEDSVTKASAVFESNLGSNIIRCCFDAAMAGIVEARNAGLAPDPSKVCDPKDCYDCRYKDLCHSTFEKRTLMERPPVAVKGINEMKLTREQLEFVTFRKGQCRVNAVAGAGKTTVVALRTLGLIEDGTAPEEILMVTFSEKARSEMAQRIQMFAQGQMMSGAELHDLERIAIETYNSWGQKLLNEHFALLGFTQAPVIVDDVQKKDILMDLLDQHRNLPLDYRNPFMSTPAACGAVVTLGKWMDALKAAHAETEQDVQEVIGRPASGHEQEVLSIYRQYNQRLMDANVLDYEDQLRLLLKLSDYGVFEKMPYRHIVVDEFQDSNPNQIAIIVDLARKSQKLESLAVVGDELQAIYGFRNSSPENLVSFGTHFPNMVDIDMVANFRSQQPIIQAANKIVSKVSRLQKVIEAHKKTSNVQPAIREIDSPETETRLFCNQVEKLVKKDGVAPNTIAILCRTKAELVKLHGELSSRNIPVAMKVPEVIAEAPYVKAIIGFASFVWSWEDMVGLALYAKSMGQDPFDKVALDASKAAVQKAFAACTSEAEKLETFFGFLEDAADDYVGAAFLNKLKGFGFRTLAQCLSYCIKYRDYGVRDTHRTADEETDCVTLITVHSAKGLEWDTVLLSLKRFPIDEESRRLFYVGVTRAKERLLMTYTKKQEVLADLLR